MLSSLKWNWFFVESKHIWRHQTLSNRCVYNQSCHDKGYRRVHMAWLYEISFLSFNRENWSILMCTYLIWTIIITWRCYPQLIVLWHEKRVSYSNDNFNWHALLVGVIRNPTVICRGTNKPSTREVIPCRKAAFSPG